MIGITQDTAKLNTALQNFSDVYNQTQNNISSLGMSDYSLNSFMNNFRDAFKQTNYNQNLTQLGISFDNTGVMSFDSSKISSSNLNSSLNANFSNNTNISNVFNKYVGTTGIVANETSADTNQLSTINQQISNQQNTINQQTQYYQQMYAQTDSQLANINNQLQTVTALMNQFNPSGNSNSNGG